MAIDKKKFLADQKWKADLLINSNKDTNIAGRREDANSWLRNWRYERGIPVDSGVMPSKDEVPTFLRPWLFPKADASPQNELKIAGGQKSDEQRAYEDFVKDSGSQPLDEQLMDMDKGRMGGGFDILNDLLPRADASPKDGMKIGMSKKDDEINRQLILNSGGANPEDYLTPKQLQRYLDNPDKFIDIDIDLVKTPSQQNATNMRELIKKLTKEGKHIEAQALYREQFPRA